MNRRMIIHAVAAVAAGTSIVGSACAASDQHGLDATALLRARIVLADAIAAAKGDFGGKAVNAGFEGDTDALLIGAAAAWSDKVRNVPIDPRSAEIIEVAEDDEDEDDEDEDDEDDDDEDDEDDDGEDDDDEDGEDDA